MNLPLLMASRVRNWLKQTRKVLEHETKLCKDKLQMYQEENREE